MAAVIAHVMIQWQESAAAVLLASRCSQTARPAKVKRHLRIQTAFNLHLSSCHQINLPLVMLPGTLEILSPPGARKNYYQVIKLFPLSTLALFPTCWVEFLFIDYSVVILHPQLLLQCLHLHWHQQFHIFYFLVFSSIFWVIFCHVTVFLDSFFTALSSRQRA